MQAIHEGRRDLAAWLEAQPTNVYDADPLLQALVARAGLADRVPSLRAWGAQVAGPLDAAVRENNLDANLPRLEAWDGIGRRAERVAHHPSYHQAGALIYGSGMLAAYHERPNPHPFILSMFYLSSHAGEAGHNCPVACAAGAIRALQALGTPEQQRAWLPRLLNTRYGEHAPAAQFLTEVQGGSDVGANACVAAPQPDGSWRISGEKWFCSSADAELFVMTARPEGGHAGTRGLGLFIVPRTVDGAPNGFAMRRLKDKLGTRSMCSAEMDFDGAYAELLGPMERAFPNLMELVIDTSRLYNAFGSAGLAHRAWLVASGYARHRQAFGGPIARYPLVQETLALALADAESSLAGSFLLAQLQQRADAGDASESELAFLRMGLNLNKVRTAILAHTAINRCLEVLGGNGTIETFSVIPRLLRDNVVFENWEGTHHTLRMQVLRDAHRLQLHRGFFAELEARLPAGALDADRGAFERALAGGDTLLLRRVCDRLGSWLQQAALADIELPGVRARAELSRRVHLGGSPDAPGYADLIARCADEGGEA